jgi:hypothetical protein
VQCERHATADVRIEAKPLPVADLIEERFDIGRGSIVVRSHEYRHCQAATRDSRRFPCGAHRGRTPGDMGQVRSLAHSSVRKRRLFARTGAPSTHHTGDVVARERCPDGCVEPGRWLAHHGYPGPATKADRALRFGPWATRQSRLAVVHLLVVRHTVQRRSVPNPIYVGDFVFCSTSSLSRVGSHGTGNCW